MCAITELSKNNIQWPKFKEKEPEPNIQIERASAPIPPQLVVQQLALIEGPVDIYCWYEGPRSLPKAGALFMQTEIFEPLYRVKQDTKLYLYSLKCWDFKKDISKMPASTSLGKAINRINLSAIECLYASSFFQYCVQGAKNRDLYTLINEQLPQKKWLFELSTAYGKTGMTVSSLFHQQSSFFDCIKDWDVSSAYSYMQYVEGYYLIQRSVREGLLKEQKKIQIAFVLPNDEGKYYQDFPKDIQKMLQLDFGKDLAGIEVNIWFQFFQYGNSLASRPYIEKQSKAPQVKPGEVASYFDYLVQKQSKLWN